MRGGGFPFEGPALTRTRAGPSAPQQRTLPASLLRVALESYRPRPSPSKNSLEVGSACSGGWGRSRAAWGPFPLRPAKVRIGLRNRARRRPGQSPGLEALRSRLASVSVGRARSAAAAAAAAHSSMRIQLQPNRSQGGIGIVPGGLPQGGQTPRGPPGTADSSPSKCTKIAWVCPGPRPL